MANETTVGNSAPFQEAMNETEIGAFLLKNKATVGIILGVVLLGLVGFGIYNYTDGKKAEQAATLVFQFRESSLKSYQEKKLDAAGLLGKFQEMQKAVGGHRSLVLPLIEVSDLLLKDKQLESAQSLLEQGLSTYGRKDAIVHYFLATRYAAVSEDLGQDQKALEALEKLMGSEAKLLESKTYLDLGRLYLKLGNKDKARTSFQHVVDNPGQTEMIKLARLYLADMGVEAPPAAAAK